MRYLEKAIWAKALDDYQTSNPIAEKAPGSFQGPFLVIELLVQTDCHAYNHKSQQRLYYQHNPLFWTVPPVTAPRYRISKRVS